VRESKQSVLIIDDEPHIRRAVRNAIAGDVGNVAEAGTGASGIDLAAAERPALIVLDLALPDMEGIEVLREIRKWSAVPIVVLSARYTDQEKVRLLDAGADDYLTKPFSTIELQARVRAHLRRTRVTPLSSTDGTIAIGALSIDLAKPVVLRDGAPVHLTRTEWDLLRELMRHAGRTQTHRQLYSAVWGKSHGDAQQNLRVHIRSLRRKLEQDAVRPTLIVTEPGVGYRLES
jgi:two-component system KDP operon response regulator KdpE